MKRDKDPLLVERERAEVEYTTNPAAGEAERQRYFDLDRKCREAGLLPPVRQ